MKTLVPMIAPSTTNKRAPAAKRRRKSDADRVVISSIDWNNLYPKKQMEADQRKFEKKLSKVANMIAVLIDELEEHEDKRSKGYLAAVRALRRDLFDVRYIGNDAFSTAIYYHQRANGIPMRWAKDQ